MMFPVYFVDQDPKETGLPADDICYLVTKKGIFLKKKVGYIESVAPVDKISFLEEIQPDAKMDINPIEAEDAVQVFTFFRAVYNLHRAESATILFYNSQTGQYKIEAPHQKVSGGGVNYARGSVMVDGYDMVGTIHSHANFNAFHSGTDKADEKSFDGLHITFGHVADDQFSISCSIVANGYRVIVDPKLYIKGLKEVQKMTYAGSSYQIYDTKTKQMVEKKTQPQYSLRYEFDLPKEKYVYPKSWLKKVEPFTVSVSNQYPKGSAWDWRRSAASNPKLIGPYESGTKPISFPSHGKDEEYNPCASCVFKMHKIEWAIEQFTELDDFDDFDDEDYDPVESHMDEDDGSTMIFEGEPVELGADGLYRHPVYGVVDPVELGLIAPEQLIQEQFESDDYLNAETKENIETPEVSDDIPEMLKDKPKSWVERFWRKVTE